MRKSVLLLVAVIFLLSLTGNAWAAKESKIGFADKMRILFEYDKAKELNEKLEKENQQAKEEFDKKAEEIKKLRDEMELLSKSAKKEKEAELQTKLQELDGFRRRKQQEIGRKYDEGIRGISQEISEACEKHGKANGYSAILDTRASLYVPGTLDITDAILRELNK